MPRRRSPGRTTRGRPRLRAGLACANVDLAVISSLSKGRQLDHAASMEPAWRQGRHRRDPQVGSEGACESERRKRDEPEPVTSSTAAGATTSRRPNGGIRPCGNGTAAVKAGNNAGPGRAIRPAGWRTICPTVHEDSPSVLPAPTIPSRGRDRSSSSSGRDHQLAFVVAGGAEHLAWIRGDVRPGFEPRAGRR